MQDPVRGVGSLVLGSRDVGEHARHEGIADPQEDIVERDISNSKYMVPKAISQNQEGVAHKFGHVDLLAVDVSLAGHTGDSVNTSLCVGAHTGLKVLQVQDKEHL